LKAAIAYLARMVRMDPGEMGGLGARKDPAAAAAFAVLRQALLFWSESSPDAEFVLVWSSRTVKIVASAPIPDEAAGLVMESGGTLSEDGLTVSLKVGREKGGSRK
jgi:hypothetical protein